MRFPGLRERTGASADEFPREEIANPARKDLRRPAAGFELLKGIPATLRETKRKIRMGTSRH
jgi:hypothetical protein